MIRELCIVSVICGLLTALTPEGNVRRISEILSCVIMVSMLLGMLKEFDIDAYALQAAKIRDAESVIVSGAEETNNRINRLVIEQEYKAYILDKAENLGIGNLEITIEMRWDMNGIWVPWAVKIRGIEDERIKSKLGGIIRDDLGIPYERQSWN